MREHRKLKKRGEAIASASPRSREKKLQNTLLARREALVSGLLRELTRNVRRAAHLGLGLDLAEQAGVSVEEEIGLTTASQRTEMVHQIDRTLQRLKEGTHGVCEYCGDEISVGRLKAMPFAVRCTACQEQWEASAARSRNGAYQPLSEAS
ncbi:MAG: TraR/DksA C4-type zinc finger protein [Candidatus Methylomirabilis oxyfera]|nr:TraR/DksA C4-type zinc finger protein [Candidatus Methylomirabilis oxyfera]